MRTAPPRRSAASNTSSLPTMAAECVRAATLPACLRPALSTTTGLAMAAARSALMKLRAFLMPSRYTTMLCVCGSAARKSSVCAMSTAVCGPSEITVEKPTLLGRAQSSRAEVSAPDCDTSASGPFSAIGPTMLELSPRCGRWKPRLFGPIKNMLLRRATARSSDACSAVMPVEMISAALQRMRPATSSAAITLCGGSATSARSAPVLIRSARRPSVVSTSRKLNLPV